MSVNRLPLLLVLGALAAGCSSLYVSQEAESESPLDTQEVTVAAGDEGLKESVEAGKNSHAVRNEPLDDAMAPELKAAAREAREKLDDPLQKLTKDSAEETDMWNRLRAGFLLDHDVDNKRVKDQLNWYAKHPGYINRVVERGSRYLYHIVNETEKRGLPAEFALLPVVESAFDPFAYSHGRAAGLWQFIPSTGKYFGLTQSWWHDDRRDVIAATDAALTYLDRLTTRFGGDYTLALAAYNSGGGTVSSAMRRNRKSNKPEDFWSLQLPQETRHYVPKLIALAKIFDDPEAYGIELPALLDEPYFDIVDTGGQLDLAQAAELAGVDIDEIYLLNPSYNRWATSPDGPHRLLVPVASAERFRQGIAAIDPDSRVSWKNYQVRSGDNLGGIARRHGTTPSVLKEINKLNTDLIRVGQQLLIPSARADQSSYSLSQSQRISHKQENAGRNSGGERVEHVVSRGDTFWDIAREHS